jgi:hypothetical protein
MKYRLTSFFTRYEFLLPSIVFLLFLASSLPGIDWGAPSLWNPDELVWRVGSALRGELVFDVTEPDFNYPSLPKYVMYAIGSITYGMGRSDVAFLVAARAFSCLLGALVGVLVYLISRRIGANQWIAFLAGLLYVVSGVAAANGRLAHNDLYLQFFTVLCLYFVILFQYTHSKLWLYASFISVGMAASSKYTGASMVLLPVGVFIIMNWTNMRREWLRSLGTLLAGGVLVIVGYGIGTPRLFYAPLEYLGMAIPAALRFSQFGFYSEIPVGVYGQWGVFEDAVGIFAYYLFLMAFVWFVVRFILYKLGKAEMNEMMMAGIIILVMNVALFDLPFLISINYIPRHFIPFVPLFAMLGAFFIGEIVQIAKIRRWNFASPVIAAVLVVGISYSLLRLVSIALLFLNDARIPASEYIGEIRGFGKSIEYTLYPPTIEKKRFMRAHNYPIYFLKYASDVIPTGGRIVYNQGEQGLLDRDTDYFVIDSHTYDRFYIDSVCTTSPVECEFFKSLLDGEITSYRLVAEFSYRLPPYLPYVGVAAVNPDVKIYERVR